MSNIIDKIQVSGVTYDIGGTGGGKAIEAGRGISITTGETADTVSFNLPISAGTGTDSIIEGISATASGGYSHAEGWYATASGFASHAEGAGSTANGAQSHAEGAGSTANGEISHAEGWYATTNGNYSHAEGYSTANGNFSHTEGYNTIAKNEYEHASGQYNVSSSASTEFGDSGNTLFSVGNGTADNARHNAFEIRQNGNIYITSGGTDILLQDNLGGGTQTIELTQAEYDALVDKDPNTFYVITDAQAGDLTNYYTKTETDNAITAATSTKQDILVSSENIKTINNESILGSGNIDIQGGGGGKAVSAGRGISITTGETADTVSFNLPISAGTGTNSIRESQSSAYGAYSHAEGNSSANGRYSHSEGEYTNARANHSHSEGYSTYAEALYSHVEGQYTTANNQSEHASGQFNVSNKANNTWGDSGNTLFSVGNGTSNSAKHNALEIRQNGDIYCSDGTNDVKLQDTITATAANTTALGGLKLVKLSQSEYDSLATKDNSTLYVIVN